MEAFENTSRKRATCVTSIGLKGIIFLLITLSSRLRMAAGSRGGVARGITGEEAVVRKLMERL